MNVVAGVVIGIVAESWIMAAEYSFYWACIHVVYGAIFGLHKNPVVASTEGGRPVVSFYVARFLTGLLTSLIAALVTVFIATFLRRT